jgi:hypothetical protein
MPNTRRYIHYYLGIDPEADGVEIDGHWHGQDALGMHHVDRFPATWIRPAA